MSHEQDVREHYRQQGRDQERNRIIMIMETEGHAFTDTNCGCQMCELFWLINDRNIL